MHLEIKHMGKWDGIYYMLWLLILCTFKLDTNGIPQYTHQCLTNSTLLQYSTQYCQTTHLDLIVHHEPKSIDRNSHLQPANVCLMNEWTRQLVEATYVCMSVRVCVCVCVCECNCTALWVYTRHIWCMWHIWTLITNINTSAVRVQTPQVIHLLTSSSAANFSSLPSSRSPPAMVGGVEAGRGLQIYSSSA